MHGLDKRLGATGVSRYHGCFLVMIDDDDGGRQMFDFRLCTVVSSWQRCLTFEARRSKSGDEAGIVHQTQVKCR